MHLSTANTATCQLVMSDVSSGGFLASLACAAVRSHVWGLEPSSELPVWLLAERTWDATEKTKIIDWFNQRPITGWLRPNLCRLITE